MTDSLEVFMATFGDEQQAAATLEDFRRMDKDGLIDLVDAAAIVRGADSKIRFDDPGDQSTKKWAKRGAIAGGLVSVIFPPGILASAALGAAGGGIWGKVRDEGMHHSDLRTVGESLEDGTSAIVAIATPQTIERLQAHIDDYRRIARHSIGDEASAAIAAEADDATSRDERD